MRDLQNLSPRERQIMDAVYRLGEAAVAEVRDEIPDPPGYDAVRTTMRLLEQKGFLKHRREGPRYLYRPVLKKGMVRERALEKVVRTFFDGSASAAALALLDSESTKLGEEEIESLRDLIARAESRRGEG